METIVELDKELFLYLNNLGNETWDNFWLITTDLKTSIPLYIFMLYLMFKNFKWRKTILLVLVIAFMITLTDQFSYFIKHTVMRPRPCGEPTLEGLGRFIASCGRYGYFSGHATSSFAFATITSLLFRNIYKYFPLLIFFWALLISYSRIYVGVHYPGDVITGMLVGILLGVLCYRLYLYLKVKFNN